MFILGIAIGACITSLLYYLTKNSKGDSHNSKISYKKGYEDGREKK
jgi:hypothetical protein